MRRDFVMAIGPFCAAALIGFPTVFDFSQVAHAAPDGAQCSSGAPIEIRIAACGAIIDAGQKSEYNLAVAYRIRCTAFARKNDFKRALPDCDQAIRLDPKDAEAFRSRCAIRNHLGEFGRAIPDCNEAIRLDPKLAAAFSDRCWAFFESGDSVRAIADCDQAIRLNPGQASAYNNRARAFSAKGDVDRALADYDQAILIDPKSSKMAYNNRANIWRNKRDYDRAIADYNEAVRLDASFGGALANRGLAYEGKGDFERARADFNAALALPATSPSGKYAHNASRERLAALKGKGAGQPATKVAIAVPAPSAVPAPVNAVERSGSSSPASRVALVIGNSAYSAVSALPNARRDADTVAASLRRVGFRTVIQYNDLARDRLIDALRLFAAEAEKAEWAVIYFAGHGIEMNGMNYLVPVDAKLTTDRDVQFEAVAFDQVMGAVEGAKKLRLVLLDACRDNPFASQMRKTVATRSIGQGLASVEPEAGTLVVYAAKHGQVALDGEGSNSPFVSSLVKRLETPGLEVRRLFDYVRDDVMEATDRRQQPFSYGSVPGREDFYFVARR